MDKLKQTFEEPEDTTGASGRVSGPGSHFASAKNTSGLGATVTGTESEAVGTPSSAQLTSGPETGGDQHVGTVNPSATGATTEQSSEAIGQTSTYSSTPLSRGDPTGSVIDSDSRDPITYQKPEASYGGNGNNSGVPQGAASAAASRAFSKPAGDDIPGSYPSQDEPSSTSATAEAAAITAASRSTADTSASTTGAATTNPGIESVDTTTGDQQGMIGKVLGAVGLGSLVGAGAATATSRGDTDSAVADTPQPISTTGLSSSTVPQQSGPPPSHHRKESIPTTAYPAGPESPRPVPPPVGGTDPREKQETAPSQEDSSSRNTALGAGAAAVGVGAIGAGTYGMHDRVTSGPSTADTTSDSRITEPSSAAAVAQPSEKVAPSDSGPFESSTTATQPEKEDHTGRNIAAGTAAGVGAGGAAAYGVHEYSQKQAEEEASRRAAEQEKEHAAQQKAQVKAAEKEQKQHEKELEKQEKAAAKDEKKHQKEVEKEEKKHEKEAAAAAAGVGAAGAGAGTYALGQDDQTRSTKGQAATDGGEAQKKPNIFKRIFKRTRKNKDTGEDEEYEEEGDDDSHGGAATAAGVGAGGAAGVGATHYASGDSDRPTTTTDPSDKSYEGLSGGSVKPSYNPFKKDDPKAQATPGSAGVTTVTEDEGTAAREPDIKSSTTFAPTQSSTTDTGTERLSSQTSDKPIEPVTQLPYDPSKDPEAAKRIEERQHGAIGLMEEAKQVRAEREAAGEELDGEESDKKKSLGTRIKEKIMPSGTGVKEDDDKLREQGFQHRSEQS